MQTSLGVPVKEKKDSWLENYSHTVLCSKYVAFFLVNSWSYHFVSVWGQKIVSDFLDLWASHFLHCLTTWCFGISYASLTLLHNRTREFHQHPYLFMDSIVDKSVKHTFWKWEFDLTMDSHSLDTWNIENQFCSSVEWKLAGKLGWWRNRPYEEASDLCKTCRSNGLHTTRLKWLLIRWHSCSIS